jgi:FkbM family methyltransferase
LKENLALNGYIDVIVSKYAVSNEKGTAELYHNSLNTGGSSMITPKERDEGTFEIETFSLQKYLDDEDIGKIDLIKIDVEGKELDVLEGINFQNTQVERIVIELHWDRIDSEKWEEEMSNWDKATDIFGDAIEDPGNLEMLRKRLEPNFIVLEN